MTTAKDFTTRPSSLLESPRDVSTELALTVFGLGAGGAGALGQIIAARRLSQYPSETIPLSRIALPLVLAASGVAAGAFLVPRE